MRPICSTEKGFSIVETMMAMAFGVIILAGALAMLRTSADVSDMIEQRNEMQQNARAALNMVASDVSQAGTLFPSEGIQLPTGKGAKDTKRGCDIDDVCYLGDLVYQDDRIYSVTPGDSVGISVNGVASDAITLVYRDPTLRLDEFPLVDFTPSGSQIEFDQRTNPPVDHPVFGVQRGDFLVISNINGNALGLATNVNGSKVEFASSDALNVNQPSADHGNIASILKPPTTTFAYRVNIVTFFLMEVETGDGEEKRYQLMRQINARPAVAVAENVLDLQFSYDVFDDDTGTATADLPSAGGNPGRIRKTNIALAVRSPRRTIGVDKDFQYVNLRTSVSSRNLSFRDRYCADCED